MALPPAVPAMLSDENRAEGWRACAFAQCGQLFQQGGSAQADRPGTRYFCSDACAIESFAL